MVPKTIPSLAVNKTDSNIWNLICLYLNLNITVESVWKLESFLKKTFVPAVWKQQKMQKVKMQEVVKKFWPDLRPFES